VLATIFSRRLPQQLLKMKTFTLNDGKKIPVIAFGTGSAFYRRNVTDAGTQAIQTGMVHLDSAQMYENEESLGGAIQAADRSKLFITTKLANVPSGKTILDTLKNSCAQLKVDHVDLFLIHSPKILSGLTVKEAWGWMEKCKEEGLAKSIGVSNFRVGDLEELLGGAKVVPAVNQIEYHAYTAKSALPLLEFHKKHNIITAAYGGLTPVARYQGGPVDAPLAKIRERLAKDSGKKVTDGQVCLKWLEAKGIVAVTTSSKKERLQEYLAAPELPGLTNEEVEEIDNAGSDVHHRHYKMMGHMDE